MLPQGPAVMIGRPPPPEPVPDMLYVETDGTGVPMRPGETAGRDGKGEDGAAGIREIKLARFFTVSRLDADGKPVMDPGSSSYVATFDGKDALAGMVEAEYLRRGGDHFRQVVAIGDGAAWIWTMAGELYPQATHITDIYHAREHLTDLAAHLAFITPDPPAWLEKRNAELSEPQSSRPSQDHPQQSCRTPQAYMRTRIRLRLHVAQSRCAAGHVYRRNTYAGLVWPDVGGRWLPIWLPHIGWREDRRLAPVPAPGNPAKRDGASQLLSRRPDCWPGPLCQEPAVTHDSPDQLDRPEQPSVNGQSKRL
jgi:hypothetical protein